MKKETTIKNNDVLVKKTEGVNSQTVNVVLSIDDWDDDKYNDEKYDNEDDTNGEDDDWDDDWYPKPNRYFLPSTNIELILGNIRRKLKL